MVFERPVFIILAWSEMVSVLGGTETYVSGYVQLPRQVISIVGAVTAPRFEWHMIGLSLVLKMGCSCCTLFFSRRSWKWRHVQVQPKPP